MPIAPGSHEVRLSKPGYRELSQRVKVRAGRRAQVSLTLAAVKGCRTVSKRDLKLNDATPKMHVDAETYTVTADGEELRCAPATVLPLAQRYFLF